MLNPIRQRIQFVREPQHVALCVVMAGQNCGVMPIARCPCPYPRRHLDSLWLWLVLHGLRNGWLSEKFFLIN